MKKEFVLQLVQIQYLQSFQKKMLLNLSIQ
jgi:hypothetical protein